MNIKVKKTIQIIFYVFLALFFIIVLFFCLFYFGLLDSFAKVKFDKNKLQYSTSQVYMTDKNNEPIKLDYIQQKNLTFNEIPKSTINAFISIEDKNFYSHHGINYKRIAKAAIKNLSRMKFSEGASTITQQLIKNTHLTSEKTFKRKFNELILARQLEKNLSKDEIITAYLNAIYFGNGTFGINEAAQRYFSKNTTDLTLTESATLAGIIKSPKTYSPVLNPENCIKRRNLVLKEMYKDKKISYEDYVNSTQSNLNLKLNKNFLGYNDYYNACIDEACKILKITEKDLLVKKYKINTYLDQDLQDKVCSEIDNLQNYTNNSNCDGLILTIDNKTGGITSFAGKSDYNLLNINRQPGSVFKPIISYSPAIENDIISEITPILDEKININGYIPHNYGNKFHGWVSAKCALANSYNIPSIKILEYLGIDKAKSFAKKMGITFDKNDSGHSLALGGLTKGIKIKDIVNCYQAFANNGKFIKSSFIKSILTQDGKTIYANTEYEKQVMKDSTAFLITDMLKESVNSGTCRKLKLKNLDIASKTGTVGNVDSTGNTDAWNISYTPSQTMCVWLGSTNSTPLSNKITGSNAPTAIAQSIYKNTKNDNQKFTIPNSIKQVELNELEYTQNNKILLATNNTPDRYKMKAYFASSNIPKNYSNMFNEIEDFKIIASKIKNSIEITFNANKYLIYEVFRQNEDNTKLISSVKNKQGLTTIIDKDIKNGNFYSYYVIARYLNSEINSSLNKQSNIVKFFVA